MRKRTKPKALRQLTLPGCDVKKANELVRSRISITDKLGSRILASLIACIRTDDTTFRDVYEISVKDFIADESGRGYTAIKEICRKLGGAFAETETVENGKQRFQVFPFFGHLDYKDGIIKARFSADIGPMLLALKTRFTRYDLLEYLKLPSIYSQRIFEILKSWSGKSEVTIPLPELHRMLAVPTSFRANFKEFRRWVLEKTHTDITEKTALRYEWQPVKVGRSVEAIRFTFGPGRKAIAEAETKKAKEEKQRRLANDRIQRAFACAKAKEGDCAAQDNKPIVCKECLRMDFCEELRRRGGKVVMPGAKI